MAYAIRFRTGMGRDAPQAVPDHRRAFGTAGAHDIRHSGRGSADQPAHGVTISDALRISDRDVSRALQILEEIVACNPRDVRAVTALGKVLYKAGRYDEAICRLQDAIAFGSDHDRGDPIPHTLLAETLLADGECRDVDGACRHLQTAMRIHNAQPRAYNTNRRHVDHLKAHLLSSHGMDVSAARIIAVRTDAALSSEARKEARRVCGRDPGRAIAILESILERNAGDWLTRTLLGKVLSIAGRHEEAVAQLERAIAVNPEHPYPRVKMTFALMADSPARNIEQACIHLQTALALIQRRTDGEYHCAKDALVAQSLLYERCGMTVTAERYGVRKLYPAMACTGSQPS